MRHFDIDIRWMAACFLDAANIGATPANVQRLLGAVGAGFVSALAREETGEGIVQRCAARSLEGGFLVVLGTKRIDVVKGRSATGGPTQLGDYAEFCHDSGALLAGILRAFERRSHRLAAVREGLLPDLGEERMNEVANRLLQAPPTLAGNALIEWQWRGVWSVPRTFGQTQNEATNTMVDVRRVQGGIIPVGSQPAIPFDRIRGTVDLNTSSRNTDERFGPQDVTAFFASVPEWDTALSADVEHLMGTQP